MRNFEEDKKKIVELCKKNNACQGEFKKLLASQNEGEMWVVLLKNAEWCQSRNIWKELPEGLILPNEVNSDLDLSGCDLKGITLPTSVGGGLYLSGCDIPNEEQFKKLESKIIK